MVLLLLSDLGSVDLDAPEWSSDINTVCSVLKMWFRDLPDPLMTRHLHQGFIEAARKSAPISSDSGSANCVRRGRQRAIEADTTS